MRYAVCMETETTSQNLVEVTLKLEVDTPDSFAADHVQRCLEAELLNLQRRYRGLTWRRTDA